MSEDGRRNDEKFLDRWSRLKQEARAQPAVPPAKRRTEPAPAPQLPSLESLTLDSDFSLFMHPGVDDGLRRTALKKLFSDPHFNRIDGLDVYIDDYTGADPIPPELLDSLMKGRRKLLARDDEAPAVETAAGADDAQAPHTTEVLPADAAGLPPPPVTEPELHDAARETASSPADVVLPQTVLPDVDRKLTAGNAPASAKQNDTHSS